MFHMGRTPKYGLYIEVFKKVSKTFLNFFLTFIFLFVGFLGAFLVLFPANRGFEELSPLTFVKILVMMVKLLIYIVLNKTLRDDTSVKWAQIKTFFV